MIRLTILTLVAALVAGCAQVRPESASYERGSFPEIEARTSVTIGNVMVEEYDYLAFETALALESVPGSFWVGRRAVTTGDTLRKARTGSGEIVYCLPPIQTGAPCLADLNGDGTFDEAYVINAYGTPAPGGKNVSIPYRLKDQNIQDGFKYELVYQGVEGDVVRIVYREYTDNLARPAFRQDLTYTLSGGDEAVSFRDVRLRIHEADNNLIEYTVDSGF